MGQILGLVSKERVRTFLIKVTARGPLQVKGPLQSRDSLSCSRDVMHLSMLSPRVEGGGGYSREFDSESLPQGREFDMSAILEDREKLEISHTRSPPEVTRSYRFLCVFANLFYFAVNKGHHFTSSSFGSFFVNCSLYMFAYLWNFYSNCACLIDYKSWFFCSVLTISLPSQ